VPGERILVAEDEPDVLDLCRRVLSDEGYWVNGVRDGYEAVKQARAGHFDLLLADIRMPGLDGLETAQAIKAFNPEVVCVTMTGFGSMDTAIEALKLGVDEFIVKPFTPEELSLAVGKALEKGRLRKENARLRALIPLFELNKTLISKVNVSELLLRVTQVAREETQADRALLYLLDEGELRLHRQLGSQSPLGEDELAAGRELAQLCLRRRDQMVVREAVPLSSDLADIVDSLRAQSLIANPLVAQSRVIGVIILLKEGSGSSFAPSDSEFLSVLAGQAAIAIENARLFTEINRAYEELQKLDRMKSEFINIAAHELRTPLAILIGYASLMEEESSGSQRHSLEIILRNAMKLRSFIDDMLNLRYLETGKVLLNLEEFSLHDLFREALTDLSPLVESKKHTVHVDVPHDFPPMVTDRQRISLAVVNLLSNAIKFTDDGGTISVAARVDADQAIVSVQDTGIGIPAEEIDNIFDRFYQVEDSLTREHGGIGLGLAIAKGMIELCKGKIWVESVVGIGSTFFFSIPLHLDQGMAQKKQLLPA
jgi:signal transduction histidine kinase